MKTFYKKYAIGFLFLGLSFFSCSKQLVRNYYVIDYVPPHLTNYNHEKIAKRLLVREMEISPIYDTAQIVIRKSMHQLQYSSYALWPHRPQYAVRDLLIKHIRNRHIFNEVDKEFINYKPDYIIKGNLYALEFYQSEQIKHLAAILEMKLSFIDNHTGRVLIEHNVNRRMELANTDFSFFVKTISQLIQEEHENLIQKILLYHKNEKKL